MIYRIALLDEQGKVIPGTRLEVPDRRRIITFPETSKAYVYSGYRVWRDEEFKDYSAYGNRVVKPYEKVRRRGLP